MSSTIVIKIGGAGVDDPRRQTDLWRAVLAAHQHLGGSLALVHGGGRAVDALLERLALPTRRVEGLRVTPPDQIDPITAVLAGSVNTNLVAAINAVADDLQLPHAPALGLSVADARLLRVRRFVTPAGADLGHVGAIVPGSTATLARLLMERGYLPVVASIGDAGQGVLMNLNADDAAAGLAQALDARALVLLTDVPAVLDERKRPIPHLDGPSIDRLIASGVITGGMIPKVRAALVAARSAGIPAFIAGWAEPADILRLARAEPAGTRIDP